MNAEEVNFGGVEDLFADSEGDWDTRNEGDEFLRFGRSNTDVPIWAPTW